MTADIQYYNVECCERMLNWKEKTHSYVDFVIKMYRKGTVKLPDGKEMNFADGGKMTGCYLDKLKVLEIFFFKFQSESSVIEHLKLYWHGICTVVCPTESSFIQIHHQSENSLHRPVPPLRSMVHSGPSSIWAKVDSIFQEERAYNSITLEWCAAEVD